MYMYIYTHTHIYTPVQKFRNRSKFDAYKICNAFENKCICIYTHMYIHTLINFVKGFRGKMYNLQGYEDDFCLALCGYVFIY